MMIPIFPLMIVQFPGVVTPLHIFEPRYRQLLRDITPGDKTFGIIYPGEDESLPLVGRVGCSVEIISQEEMPDGRSNILCVGKDRFIVKESCTDQPYLQAEVEYFDDDVITDIAPEQIEKTRDYFLRIIAAGKKLRTDESEPTSTLPQLPDNPTLLSFIIAASLDANLDEKQIWLEMKNTAKRLSILTNQLKEFVETYELRAQVHQMTRKNGFGGSSSNLT